MPHTMTEAQAVNIMRNALIASGEEMGRDGDHWPVIKSTVLSITKEWEELQVERNVDAELKVHLRDIIDRMEKNLETCPAELRHHAGKLVHQAREAYDAYFADVDMTMHVICDEDVPIYVKRAMNIVKVLEE